MAKAVACEASTVQKGMERQICGILAKRGILPIARFRDADDKPTPPVCISRLSSPEGDIYTVLNPGYYPADIEVTVNACGTLVPLSMPDQYEHTENADSVELKLSLRAWGTAVFALNR